METSKQSQLATIIVAALILIGVVGGGLYKLNQKNDEIMALTTEKNNLNVIIQQKDSTVNDMESIFAEIESNMTFIREKKAQIATLQTEGGKNKRQLIAENVKLMNTMLEESAKKITELEAKLRASGMNLKAYEKKIQALNESIEAQNAEIAQLKKTIDDKNASLAQFDAEVKKLNTDIKEKVDTITYKQSVIVDKTNKLNTAYYTLGSFKKLKEEGILNREGAFLGIGGAKAIQDNFDPKHFTEIDIRNVQKIDVKAKKAVLVSEHPSNSYKLVEENGQIAYLQIENPQEFWRISKYAVIQVK
jgi:peptidoglycan hydrolase CwlO-like protein